MMPSMGAILTSFLSTLSLRRATSSSTVIVILIKNFYPRSPCGERLWPGLLARPFFIISIHALLAESDSITIITTCIVSKYFYPRSPCGERPERLSNALKHLHFYPRSPCGERRNASCNCHNVRPISIHALLAESDGKSNRLAGRKLVFLSTLSLRRATCYSLRHSA